MAGEKSTAFSTAMLQLFFNGTTIVNLATNATSAPLTSLYAALHTADPLAGGNQSTSEVTYTGYARVAVARTSGGWVITGNSVSPANPIQFPAGTGGSGTATYWSIGVASSGAGMILYTGPITPSIVLGNGVSPIITTSSTCTES